MDKQSSAEETKATGAAPPTVVAVGSSVVTARDIKGVKVKSVKMKIETEGDPDNKPGNAAAPLPKADYSASGGSVICADVITGMVADEIDFSICVKKPQVRAEQVDETPQPLNQGPAVSFIIDHKVELIRHLRADRLLIEQHVHAQKIITQEEYLTIKDIPDSEKAVIEIIDKVIRKGQDVSSLFLKLLKTSEVLETLPELKKITDLLE